MPYIIRRLKNNPLHFLSHLVDCFEANEFNSSLCGDGVSGSGMDLLMGTIGDSRRRRDARDDVMTDVLDSYGFRMRKDLVEFVRMFEMLAMIVSDVTNMELYTCIHCMFWPDVQPSWLINWTLVD